MAVDWRLEKFAVNIFFLTEHSAGIPFLLESRCKKYNNGTERDHTGEMRQLVFCRLRLFKVKLMELEKDLELFKSNDVDFLHYIRGNMTKYFPYPHMNIFDKIFMSCAVVTKMSHLLFTNKMYRDTAPLSWVMYFEAELKEEFYAVEDCWAALRKYSQESYTYVIMDWRTIDKPSVTFQTDLELAEYVRIRTENLFNFSDIIETFKQRIKRPLGSLCCSKCLPLFDALYLLTYGDKLVSDFQLTEGYFQIFLRMWYFDRIKDMLLNYERNLDQTKLILSRFFHRRIFKDNNFDNSEEEHGGNVCMFCGVDEKKNGAYLKSIICRTAVGEEANAEKVLDRNEERRALGLFLKLGLETAQS